MRYICVFCGSSIGKEKIHQEAARILGKELHHHGYGLVYGGGKVGLMGIIADAVLAQGGSVIGVLPEFMIEKEVAHTGLSQLIVTRSMHERKAKMAELADAFIALPGGYGTLEEFFEVLTWAQLELHPKPLGLLNSEGYYDALLQFLDTATEQQFVSPTARHLIISSTTPSDIVHKIITRMPPLIESHIQTDVSAIKKQT